MRRLPLAAAVAAVGGLLVLIAAGRTWGSALVTSPARQHVTVTGRQIAAGLPALAWAVIALAVAVLAARGRLRRAAALVGVVVSAAALAVAIGAHADVGRGLAARAFGVPARSLNAPTNLWWLVALLGAAVAASAYAAVVVLGAQWQGMGTRYDAPGSPAPTPSPGGDPAVEAWDALDRGDDPTARHPTD